MNNQRILKSLAMVWKSDRSNPLVKGYLSQLGINLVPSPKLRVERLEYEVSKVLCEAGLIECDLAKLENLAIASEDALKKALAPFELEKAEISSKLLAIEIKRIEIEAELAKARAEFEELKRIGYNPIAAIFQAGLTTTQATKDLLVSNKLKITEKD